MSNTRKSVFRIVTFNQVGYADRLRYKRIWYNKVGFNCAYPEEGQDGITILGSIIIGPTTKVGLEFPAN